MKQQIPLQSVGIVGREVSLHSGLTVVGLPQNYNSPFTHNPSSCSGEGGRPRSTIASGHPASPCAQVVCRFLSLSVCVCVCVCVCVRLACTRVE